MVFLAHLGHGLAFAILDDLFSEPEPTCWCVVWQLRRLFQVKLLKPYVQWPDAAERDRIAAWFNIYANMPGCIGMINDLLFSCLCAPPYILPIHMFFVRSPRLTSRQQFTGLPLVAATLLPSENAFNAKRGSTNLRTQRCSPACTACAAANA